MEPKAPASQSNPLTTVLLGFHGHDLPPSTAELLGRGVGGVVLFRRNLGETSQVRALCGAVREASAGWPAPIIGVDQEGGRVQRLRGLVPDVPPMGVVGRRGPEAARETGVTVGRTLIELGFNTDFAPVLDVDSNPRNPIIGDRAFSSDPGVVAHCAIAFTRGLESAGVLACGKHFPGHGDTSADSHEDLPVVDIDGETLRRREMVPFAAAVRDGIKMVMTAHCLYPAVDSRWPGTLSSAVVNGLLRTELGFEGVVVTDDLGMKAVSERHGDDEVLRHGFDAGVDLFMQCGAKGEGERLVEALLGGLAGGLLDEDRVSQAADRVLKLRKQLG